MRTESPYTLYLVVGLMLLAGCRQEMASQPSYRPLEASTFFEDGRSERPLVPGTVPRGYLREDTHLYTGRSGAAGVASAPVAATSGAAGVARYVDTFPFEITRPVLERGRERFNIFCAVCHDRAGTGQGMIVQRGFTRPPSFHTDASRKLKVKLRDAPVGYYFDVISHGFGAMPDYATQVSPRDRWAIIAYVRALQLSQQATLADVPADERQQLETGGLP